MKCPYTYKDFLTNNTLHIKVNNEYEDIEFLFIYAVLENLLYNLTPLQPVTNLMKKKLIIPGFYSVWYSYRHDTISNHMIAVDWSEARQIFINKLYIYNKAAKRLKLNRNTFFNDSYKSIRVDSVKEDTQVRAFLYLNDRTWSEGQSYLEESYYQAGRRYFLPERNLMSSILPGKDYRVYNWGDCKYDLIFDMFPYKELDSVIRRSKVGINTIQQLDTMFK